ncbi:MAG TPA: hypothetical protein VF297_02960 [Pyrinomonadaceae bacterium]
MKEPRQQQNPRDEEATLVVGGEETTLVAPRFDDEETLVARPVVPLEQGAPSPSYRAPYAPRRRWTLALVLASVLTGGVLGGAGLYLYQRQSHDAAASPAATTQPAPPAEATQAPAAPVEVQQPAPNAEPSVQQTDATAAAPNAEVPAPRDEEPTAAAPAREPVSVPATERRTEPSEGTPRRGKKGSRDEEPERRPTSRPDGNVARAEAREARRVDSIFYRPRRAERRARRRDDVDRLRRIFEGGPQ